MFSWVRSAPAALKTGLVAAQVVAQQPRTGEPAADLQLQRALGAAGTITTLTLMSQGKEWMLLGDHAEN